MAKREPQPIRKTGPRPKFKNQEAREKYLIGLAYDLVEERLLNGTATSQETVHFLRMGSAKEQRDAKLEEMQIELMKAKKEALDSQKNIERMLEEGFAAYTSYQSPVTMEGEDLHE